MSNLAAIVGWVDRCIAEPVNKAPLIPLPLLLLLGVSLRDVPFVMVTTWMIAGLWTVFVFWRLSIFLRAALKLKKGSREAKRFIRGDWS